MIIDLLLIELNKLKKGDYLVKIYIFKSIFLYKYIIVVSKSMMMHVFQKNKY